MPAIVDADALAPWVTMALDGVAREYPNHISHLMRDAADAGGVSPRALHPAFYGCLDWHSAVHAHWLLARALRLAPDASFAPAARAALDRALTAEAIAAEVDYLEPRPGYERPYGLAWAVALDAELRRSDLGARWLAALAPLTAVAARRLADHASALSHPVRSGVHSQTAFALALAVDAAVARGDDETAASLRARARDFYGDDRGYPLHLEPSGEDFLSPSLAAADLMRRALEPQAFAVWLSGALPQLPHDVTGDTPDWLTPVAPPDRADGRLAHLDGLSFSRAWMMDGIADGLPAGDLRIAALRGCAAIHRRAGEAARDALTYAGTHWLATFAVCAASGGTYTPVR